MAAFVDKFLEILAMLPSIQLSTIKGKLAGVNLDERGYQNHILTAEA